MSKKRTQIEVEGIERGFAYLDGKPAARLSYSFIPATNRNGTGPQRVLVFLNGLDSPQTVWQKGLSHFISQSKKEGFDVPPIIVYDRYGVGNSDHDPSDAGKDPTEYHDAMESMRDLRRLLVHVSQNQLGLTPSRVEDLRVVFCAYSIGCCVARFYADAYPGTVEALLLIDSAIAGTAFEKMVPDPDIPEEWEARKPFLPSGTTADQCREAIQKSRKTPYSGYAMTTRERLRWDNMPQQLPSSHLPQLKGPKPSMPLVTVIVGDPGVAIHQLAKVLRVPEQFAAQTWMRAGQQYAAGLIHLQPRGVGKGPIIATGCGHNVPGEAPELISNELAELLIKVSNIDKSKI